MFIVRSIPFVLLLLFFGITSAARAADSHVVLVLVPESVELRELLENELDDTAEAPESRFEARRQARSAANRLGDYLKSEGYLAADLLAGVIDTPALVGQVKITPGPRFTIQSIEIRIDEDTATNETVTDLYEHLTIKENDFAIAEEVFNTESALLNALKEGGYAFAEIGEREVTGNTEAASVEITLNIIRGPRVRFGDVKFDEDARTRVFYLDQLVPFEKNELFTPQQLNLFNNRLAETGIYTTASATLSDTPAEIDSSDDEIRDVLVSLTERDRFTISAGLTYSSSEGIGVNGGWARRNATRRGDTVNLSATVAEQRRAVDASWRVPNALGYGRSWEFNGAAGDEDTDAFERDFLTVGGALELKKTPWLTYSIGVASEFTRETDAIDESDLYILSLSGGARIDHTDDIFDPTRGWRADFRIEPGLVTGDKDTEFVQTSGQLSVYRALTSSRRIVAAGRVRVGVIFGADALELPTSRRFFAGGGSSTRGFAYQSISPKDDEDRPLGGRSLFETAAELRFRMTDQLGFVAFVDAASVTSSDSLSADDLRYGYGLGIRYYTPIGPIRVDVATPYDRTETEDSVQLYISIGQAF